MPKKDSGNWEQKRPAPNRPLACMGAEVKTQRTVLRKNISDYPQYSAYESPRKQVANRYVPAARHLSEDCIRKVFD